MLDLIERGFFCLFVFLLCTVLTVYSVEKKVLSVPKKTQAMRTSAVETEEIAKTF